MTVRELVAELLRHPADMKVCVTDCEFGDSLVQAVDVVPERGYLDGHCLSEDDPVKTERMLLVV